MNQQKLSDLESKLDLIRGFFYKLSELSRSMAESLDRQPVAPIEVEVPQWEQIVAIAKEILRENTDGLTVFQIADKMIKNYPALDKSIIATTLLVNLKNEKEISSKGKSYAKRVYKMENC
jgi:hypothetical protein